MARAHLKQQIANPALHSKLTRHYGVGCKHVLFSNDFYPSIARASVALETYSPGTFCVLPYPIMVKTRRRGIPHGEGKLSCFV